MELPMKVVVIMLIAMITLVIIIILMSAWGGRGTDIIEGIFGFLKDLGGPIGGT